MSSSKLIQWSGLAALVGGALLVVLSILEFVLFSGQAQSEAVTSSAWIIVEISYVVTTVLLILGLMGLYARQAEQAGSLGLIAFLVALTGTVMLSGLDWSAAFFGPWAAEVAPPELLTAEPSGSLLVGLLLTLVLFALGWLLFGLASLQAGVLPRGAAALLMVGALLAFIMLFLEIPFEVAVLGVALAWMGYDLWSAAATPDEPALTTRTAM
jgi:hypothetical protein